MESVAVTANLTMLRLGDWLAYMWQDGESCTLIDTGPPGSRDDIAAACRRVDRIVITHGHVDHCGSAAELRDLSGAPVLAGAGDAAAIRGDEVMPPPVFEDWEKPLWERVSIGLPAAPPPSPVDRELHDGDALDFGDGAKVIATPGHTEGSIAIYLPRHRVLFTGDTIANVGRVMLGVFNQDRTRTIASFKRLAELDVETACFGHGEPITTGAGARIRKAAADLA